MHQVTQLSPMRGAETPVVIERPETDDKPTKVSTGIWIVDITNIDSAQQNFIAEVAIVLRWKDPRLAHTGKGVVRYSLEQIWHPRMAIVNEQILSVGNSRFGGGRT